MKSLTKSINHANFFLAVNEYQVAFFYLKTLGLPTEELAKAVSRRWLIGQEKLEEFVAGIITEDDVNAMSEYDLEF